MKKILVGVMILVMMNVWGVVRVRAITCTGSIQCLVWNDTGGTCGPANGQNAACEDAGDFCDWAGGGGADCAYCAPHGADCYQPPGASPPPGGGGSGGGCGSLSQPSCGAGTCTGGKVCVGQGASACGCANPPDGSVVGNVENYSCPNRTINGWTAYSSSSANIWAQALLTSPYWLGGPLQTNIFRLDVNTAYGIDGYHGFAIPFPASWIDGVTRSVYVYGSVTADSPLTQLPGSPVSITCAPPANTAPTGTLDCPSSPMDLGNSASFTLHGSDAEGNLSKAQLWRSPASPVNPGGDWTAINDNVACTGASCNPSPITWTPPIGTYRIAANYFDNGTPAKQCSGNPFVTYPINGFEACPVAGDNCTLQVVINGVCNNAVLGACTAGTPTTPVENPTNWTWTCLGVNGGSTDSCSKAKPKVAGHVYNDVNNTCSTSTGFDGITVKLDGSPYTTAGGGAFSFFTPTSGLHSLAVTLPSDYVCSGCNALSCSTKDVTVPPDSLSNNFFLTPALSAWWQAEGAGVYAGSTGGGVTIKSEVPPGNYLLIPGSAGSSVGALMRASGNYEKGDGVLSTPAWNAITKYGGEKMNYDFFAKQMGVIAGQSPSWGSTLNQGNCTAGAVFCYGPAATMTAWNVTNGQKYVILVNGDLRISANVGVDLGGFLAVIVKGSVTIDPSVGSVQGLYVMNNNFVTEVSATQLVVQGSVVTWGGVSLNRDLGLGNSVPAEQFVYRPDLLINMPKKMKTFGMEWSEVVPGSYGN